MMMMMMMMTVIVIIIIIYNNNVVIIRIVKIDIHDYEVTEQSELFASALQLLRAIHIIEIQNV